MNLAQRLVINEVIRLMRKIIAILAQLALQPGETVKKERWHSIKARHGWLYGKRGSFWYVIDPLTYTAVSEGAHEIEPIRLDGSTMHFKATLGEAPSDVRHFKVPVIYYNGNEDEARQDWGDKRRANVFGDVIYGSSVNPREKAKKMLESLGYDVKGMTEANEAHSRHYYDTDRNKPMGGLCKHCGFHLSYNRVIGDYCANAACPSNRLDDGTASRVESPPFNSSACHWHSEQAQWLLKFIARNKNSINRLLK